MTCTGTMGVAVNSLEKKKNLLMDENWMWSNVYYICPGGPKSRAFGPASSHRTLQHQLLPMEG